MSVGRRTQTSVRPPTMSDRCSRTYQWDVSCAEGWDKDITFYLTFMLGTGLLGKSLIFYMFRTREHLMVLIKPWTKHAINDNFLRVTFYCCVMMIWGRRNKDVTWRPFVLLCIVYVCVSWLCYMCTREYVYCVCASLQKELTDVLIA